MKKLKIQFWKAEKALSMQILEQEGLPKEKRDGFIRIIDSSALDFDFGARRFKSNAERDAYLDKVVNAITDELFTGEGELEVGEICEVKDDEDEQWKKRKLLAILPKEYDNRFIVESWNEGNIAQFYNYARPIGRTEPTVEECGQLITYTWEEK